MSVFPLFVIEHEDEGRNRKEIKQMDTDRQTHQEGYEDDPPVGIRSVGLVVPLCHRPEHQRSDKGRHGVHLSFHSREPECVAECICKCAHGS